ncbi:hypothetical protein NPIL_621391 [Nephila pilipes]|uniref:Uncharacterized protein n=2 Tax=Nephila pilipes TaxID=299642 RepID=A0A8X6QAR7_NEPPI|nr:hypothetical protein NPIL_621391 [Nephila pilipes]
MNLKKKSEDVFIDYRKQLDRSWRPSEGLFVESNGRSNHRFFQIMLTYHVLYEFYFDEDSGSLIALQLSWRSISDAFVTRGKMIGSLWRFSRNNIFLSKRTEMIFDNVNLIHPEITVPGPRSLQHLSRCSLRQRLDQRVLRI